MRLIAKHIENKLIPKEFINDELIKSLGKQLDFDKFIIKPPKDEKDKQKIYHMLFIFNEEKLRLIVETALKCKGKDKEKTYDLIEKLINEKL